MLKKIIPFVKFASGAIISYLIFFGTVVMKSVVFALAIAVVLGAGLGTLLAFEIIDEKRLEALSSLVALPVTLVCVVVVLAKQLREPKSVKSPVIQ